MGSLSNVGFQDGKRFKSYVICSLSKVTPCITRFVTSRVLALQRKFTMAICGSSTGYVTRINYTKPADLPEPLPILKIVYQARLMMENTNTLSKQRLTDIDVELEPYNTIIPLFTSEGTKRKRRRSSRSIEE